MAKIAFPEADDHLSEKYRGASLINESRVLDAERLRMSKIRRAAEAAERKEAAERDAKQALRENRKRAKLDALPGMTQKTSQAIREACPAVRGGVTV